MRSFKIGGLWFWIVLFIFLYGLAQLLLELGVLVLKW